MKKIAIGIMSGTSLDGIDVVLTEIEGLDENTKVKVLAFRTYAYEPSLKTKIIQALSLETSNAKLLSSLNVELAQAYGACVFALCKAQNISLESIDFIAMHGQTIYHIDGEASGFVPSSLQLGDGSYLATITQSTVVSNFRNADIALGGRGAPLVPFADYVLFRDLSKDRLLQNIGGISNLCYIPANATIDDVIAFDNGPGNMMIDRAMQLLFDKPFDKDGEIAAKGQVIETLFDEILAHPFFQQSPPKSTGREVFGDQYTDALLKRYQQAKPEDIITTLTHVTAHGITDAYQRFLPQRHPTEEIILSGGGAHNKTLVSLIKHYAGCDRLYTTLDFGIDGDALEALAFVILGHQTLAGRPANVPNATGAKSQVVLGSISHLKERNRSWL